MFLHIFFHIKILKTNFKLFFEDLNKNFPNLIPILKNSFEK